LGEVCGTSRIETKGEAQMRFVTFNKAGKPTVGVRQGDDIVDLSAAAPRLPKTLAEILAGGRAVLDQVRAAIAKPRKGSVLKARSVALLPPIPDPGKILCVGLNYKDHAAETGNALPTYPVIFTRFNSTLTPHDGKMPVPKASAQLDYEAELAVVIGKRGRNVPKARALSLVGGYACFNDGSVRDYQMKTSQFTLGKNFDGTGGFGPDVVTPDELPKGANGLKIQCRLNGKLLQDGTTADLVFDVASLIAELSTVMTLEPGDVIITGTPAGVGFTRNPKLFMKPGDVCEVEIEKIGVLRNKIVAGK
jgi:2-keto-4-pentenoate hydratase/2-oxohepta-3-ene-1,7-dioic acid hydratase in catechol pathway